MWNARLLLFCAGILSAAYLSRLPAPAWLLVLLLPLLFCIWPRIRRWLSMPASFCAGLAWGIVSGYWLLSPLLPVERSGEDFFVRGVVVGLPDTDFRRTRFVLELEALEPMEGPPLARSPRRVQVSWYRGEVPASGEHWQLRLRLNSPRGFVNPGGFDYQGWLLRQGIHASGYVRADGDNRILEGAGTGTGVWRQQLRQWLVDSSDSDHKDLLLALLIGDRSMIGPVQWQQLQSTGTNHLVAISGLHVGFVALLGFVVGSGLGRVVNLLWHRVPAAIPAHLCASGLAFTYAALAGFSLPTQRALIMVLVAQWAWLRRRTFKPVQGLLVALLAVVLLDPLASLDLGFWLSFGAVGVLMLAFSGRQPTRAPWPGQRLVQAQWVIFIGLMVPLAVLMHSIALLAPVANLLAIPLVTFAVVPWLLTAAALREIWPWLSDLSLRMAEWGIHGLAQWLDWLVQLGGAAVNPVLSLAPVSLLLATLAVLMLLLPKGIAVRWLGYPALLLAVLAPPRVAPALTVTTLDLGQALAMVIRTPNHTLVFDTGLAYSERMEAGGAIIAPYLRSRGSSHVDKIVISHDHSDHTGGLFGLLAQMPARRLLVGQSLTDPPPSIKSESCHTTPPWRWDQVDFRFLTWTGLEDPSSNNQSCVLLIEYAGEQILLTGDIEREVEWRLYGQGQLPEAIRLLQVPHHGSRTSSTRALVQRLAPHYSVVSASYLGRHGHPHAEVLERYHKQGTQVLNTADSGAVIVEWHAPGQPPAVIRARERWRRYWYQ
ncbi:DNA internalization-related competence protein ComEC/Rec2 [Marinimicrobium sp. ABcell2]|uniref:DNA internalization-related competence protein ComEC/Rec2 n=1 Tax=Marinimicrobium sp. ABcell2 TaxID=3069751 RepID=UPI0027B7910C|nr:DNA internalization-related competence protein ComEC/Rec2 [Marinimicrobium sp. ABcell2]MDQ2075605.1 DNA internalization-related competence protein ComEC/Rec2 [Marinimicrobium sp. ABcell2]